MGFFKDIHTIQKQAKEIDKTWDPGAQAREANARMAEMNQMMSQATAALAAPPEDGIEANAQLVSAGNPTGMVNTDPIVPVELLVVQDGLPPRPVSLSVIVPTLQMHRLQPGAMLPVRISRTDPSALAVDWVRAG